MDERLRDADPGVGRDGRRQRAEKHALFVIAAALEPYATGPPLHLHPALDTTYFVLEGNVTFEIGGSRLTALRGASVNVPSGTPHTYANPGSAPAHLVVVNARGEGPLVVHRVDIVGPPLGALSAPPPPAA